MTEVDEYRERGSVHGTACARLIITTRHDECDDYEYEHDDDHEYQDKSP